MAVSKNFIIYVIEQLMYVANVTSRRMFGGVGLYADGLFFGLIAEDTLYFKVDDSNRSDYERRGSKPFCPFPDKSEFSMSYFDLPADVLEDAEELACWARKSVMVASAAASRKAIKQVSKKTKKKAAKKAAGKTKSKARSVVKKK
jgi:DNA transformation protein